MVSDICKIEEAWYFYQLHGTCGGFYGFVNIYLAQ